MSQFPQITSNLSTANFRASVLTQLAEGIPVTIAGSSGATTFSVSDHNSGVNGGKIVPATTASGTGNWYALQFVTSGTLTAYAGNITGTIIGVTFPAGFVLYGNTTSFTTGSGTSVIAYTF
jgi:hypothetical protein